MKKQLLKERFQQLAGLKPLYENYAVYTYYAKREKTTMQDSSDIGMYYSEYPDRDSAEYVSETATEHLKAYEGDDKPYVSSYLSAPGSHKNIYNRPTNAKSFGEGDDGKRSAESWVKIENEFAQKKYAKFEEGGEYDRENYSPEKFGLEVDENGNIVKYSFIVSSITSNRTF